MISITPQKAIKAKKVLGQKAKPSTVKASQWLAEPKVEGEAPKLDQVTPKMYGTPPKNILIKKS